MLERPEIPLNTNASENDIRAFVTKRKISGGTVSEKGRQGRDVMLGLAKTCTKLKIPFFDYLGARLGIPGPPSHTSQPSSLPLQPDQRPAICPGYRFSRKVFCAPFLVGGGCPQVCGGFAPWP